MTDFEKDEWKGSPAYQKGKTPLKPEMFVHIPK